MAKWLMAECPQCGPFWAQETLERKIERCSKWGNPNIRATSRQL
jgi:ribosomal protein S27AE